MSVEETQLLKPTRTSFIRSLPENMPVDEVIERGREAGITIQPSDVHSVRYYMRQEADARLSARPSPVSRVVHPLRLQPNPVPATQSEPAKAEEPEQPTRGRTTRVVKKPRAKVVVPPMSTMKEQLKAIVLCIGSDRARAFIQEIEDATLRDAMR